MGEKSKIQWCDHTFNPWWGCAKVPGDPACHNCYAEAFAKRTGHKVWGNEKPRRELSDSHWKGPEKWNSKAEKTGVRARVFCASMADVFEDRRDLDGKRERLAELIRRTPYLDWLLLTKRPEHFGLIDPMPENVWLGVTAATQKHYDERVPILMQQDVAVRFISAEPLMERVGIFHHVDWVIFGGESGPRSRTCQTEWIREGIRDCQNVGAAPFVKQLGAKSDLVGIKQSKGGDMDEWPRDLQIREFPRAARERTR